jgi:hypothetical protein
MSAELPLERLSAADRARVRAAIARAETARELIWITEDGKRIASIVALSLAPANG